MEMTSFATHKLLHEIQNLKLEEVEEYVKQGDLTARDKKGNTCLHIGVSCGSPDAPQICRLMLEAKADVEGLNDNNETPLVWAIYLGLFRVAKVLLEYGANKNVQVEGASLQHFAAASVLPRSLEFLSLTCGCDFDVTDHEGKTPIMYAAERNLALHIKWLIAHGVDVLKVDQNGETALFKAVRHNSTRAVWALLEYKPYMQLRIRNQNHCTAIQVAEATRNPIRSDLRRLAERQNSCFLPCFDRWTNNVYRIPSRRITALKFKAYFTALVVLVVVQTCLYFLPHDLIFSCVLLSLLGMGVLFYIAINLSNPGYIPTSVLPASKRAAQEGEKKVGTMRESLLPEASSHGDHIVAYQETIMGALEDQNVCITCKTNVPLRSKHCKELDRCVYRYDHFCPFLGTAVGRSNHTLFLIFLVWFLAVFVCYFYLGVLSFLRLSKKDFNPIQRNTLVQIIIAAIAGINALLMLIFDASLLVSHLYLISVNLTTNEYINHTKYPYLNSEGQFYNQFNRGICANCCEFWCTGEVEPKLPT